MTRSLLVGAVLAISGCGQDAEQEYRIPVEVRDSAGIRIVENLRVEDPISPWKVSEEPAFRLGWEDTGPLFENLVAGAILSDGRVVVAEGNGSGIYYFGSKGSLQRRVGRTGEGPAEFLQIIQLVRMPGDSVLIQDDESYRGSIFDPQGDFVRDYRLVHRQGQIFHLALGVLEDHSLLLWPTSLFVDAMSESGWIKGALQRWHPDWTNTDTIFAAGFVSQRGPGDIDPFQDWGFMDGGSDGVLYGRTDKGEVSWIDGEGSILQISRWIPNWREVDDVVWDEYAGALWAKYPSGDSRILEERLAGQREAASEMLPLFGFLHLDSEGNAWIAEYEFFAAPPSRYMVIQRDGTRSGWIEVPEGFRILDIGEDRILGVETNEWDVQAVSVYLIDKN